jgi:hypothetical protein
MGLRSGDTSQAQLGKWQAGFVEGMNRMRRLVCEYYDGLQNEQHGVQRDGRMRRLVCEYYDGFNFGQFVRSFPHHRGNITDLLIGDLFKPELDQVFDDIDAMKERQLAAQ